MIGIINIASFLPQSTISNRDLMEKFSLDDDFLQNKIGVQEVTVTDRDVIQMCVEAFKNLTIKQTVPLEKIQAIVLVTQNPDILIPHNSAILHSKLGLPTSCASFDISQGCSGYVYGLSVLKSFMESNNLEYGLLFTCDPYSKIINREDKNTTLLFGDAATVTLMGKDPKIELKKFQFGTVANTFDQLTVTDQKLVMSGRGIFNFVARYVPGDIEKLLTSCNKTKEDIDLFIFHQGSKYIVDTLKSKLNLNEEKVPFAIRNHGNTVSSSIPLILERTLEDRKLKNIVLSGFGVGLSWANAYIERTNI